MILWIWVLCTLIVMAKMDKPRWDKLEHAIIDFAWASYMPVYAGKVVAAIVMIVLSPYFTFLIVTKPIRDKLK